MSYRKCATVKCTGHVRSGLDRSVNRDDGLADGTFCHRCRKVDRQRFVRAEKRKVKERNDIYKAVNRNRAKGAS